jgi:DegV family protein with EDD domain
MAVRIVTDSTCDLPPAILSQYDIRVIPLYIHVGEQSYLDGVDITRQEFYRSLPAYPTSPTTAVPSPDQFRLVYNSLAEQGASEILSIHISSSLSAVMDVARLASRETTTVPVTVLESRQLSLGTGFLVETAAHLAAQGRSVGEIMPLLEAQIKRTHVFAALDTMEFLKRSGRVNAAIATMGSFLQIKPIMKMHDGVASAERVRTSAHAITRIVQLLQNLGKLERVAFVHTNAPGKVEELRKAAAHLLPPGEILAVDITPVIGAHIGPGAAGFAAITAS